MRKIVDRRCAVRWLVIAGCFSCFAAGCDGTSSGSGAAVHGELAVAEDLSDAGRYVSPGGDAVGYGCDNGGDTGTPGSDADVARARDTARDGLGWDEDARRVDGRDGDDLGPD